MAKREAAAVLSAVFAILLGANAAAQEDDSANTSVRPDTANSICLMAQAAASANGLPFEFFARLIWQESRFQPDAVGPVTRNGERARGIAQFMPRTASEVGRVPA
jgi:soluble lytic murein transglycosylase-like protein